MPTTSTAFVPAVSSTSLPTAAMDCPTAAKGTIPLKDDDNGFCLPNPAGYGVVTSRAGELSLVPEEPPYIACNGASLFLNVEGEVGRTVDQVADAVTVDMNCSDERYNLTIANEKQLS